MVGPARCRGRARYRTLSPGIMPNVVSPVNFPPLRCLRNDQDWETRIRDFVSGPLNIYVPRLQGMLDDEVLARFDLITHEDREYLVGLHAVLYAHLKKGPLV